MGIFSGRKPVIACIHLLPLPGAPRYRGSMQEVVDRALNEGEIFARHGADALIVENFRDNPFFPGRVPAETVAAMSVVLCELGVLGPPLGVNVLRNDAESAVAIACATGAAFVRVNVHMGAVIADQGLIEGRSYETLRLRERLKCDTQIFADVGVKHASPLGSRGLDLETRDVTERGLASAIVVSGALTGESAAVADLDLVKASTRLPVLVGSGTTLENLEEMLGRSDGMIVGSHFKRDGRAENEVDEDRVKRFFDRLSTLRARPPART